MLLSIWQLICRLNDFENFPCSALSLCMIKQYWHHSTSQWLSDCECMLQVDFGYFYHEGHRPTSIVTYLRPLAGTWCFKAPKGSVAFFNRLVATLSIWKGYVIGLVWLLNNVVSPLTANEPPRTLEDVRPVLVSGITSRLLREPQKWSRSCTTTS